MFAIKCAISGALVSQPDVSSFDPAFAVPGPSNTAACARLLAPSFSFATVKVVPTVRRDTRAISDISERVEPAP
jgi:hypothetical protein